MEMNRRRPPMDLERSRSRLWRLDSASRWTIRIGQVLPAARGSRPGDPRIPLPPPVRFPHNFPVSRKLFVVEWWWFFRKLGKLCGKHRGEDAGRGACPVQQPGLPIQAGPAVVARVGGLACLSASSPIRLRTIFRLRGNYSLRNGGVFSGNLENCAENGGGTRAGVSVRFSSRGQNWRGRRLWCGGVGCGS